MKQLQMFDDEEGKRRRDDAIERVEKHADEDWMVAAWSALHIVLRKYLQFSTDQIWAVLAMSDIPPPHEPRAMGAIMKQAQKEGLCRPLGMVSYFVPSRRPEAHRGPKRMWKSLLYKADD